MSLNLVLHQLPCKRRDGFTLVELLIVVAIIGVLATVGIPTFKRMMEKSRQSEAKVNLGNLFTVEAAFYSEYGVYGDNLTAMGYEVDGNPAQMTYRFGFTSGTNWSDPGVAPTQASAAQPAITLAIPTYFTGYNVANANCFGRCVAGGGGSTLSMAFAATTPFPDPASSFQARADGVVVGGVDQNTAGGTATNIDSWTIDNTRTLFHANDGVR